LQNYGNRGEKQNNRPVFVFLGSYYVLYNERRKEMNSNKRYKRLEAVIEQNQDYLFRFAYFRIGNREDAEDIIQDVFLRLFEKEFVIENDESMRMYLYRMVYNACNDWHRHKQQEPIPLEQVQMTYDEEQALQEEYNRIWKMLSVLPADQADAITMHLTDGLTFVEIAKVTGTPETTIKSRFKSGIDKLRKRWEQEDKI
jgi:RNA polymerase sigma-70 factor (ECF subfamily)